MDADVAPIHSVDDEVDARPTASVRIPRPRHCSGPEFDDAGSDEIRRIRMRCDILRPREACRDVARLSSTGIHLHADQPLQFCPGGRMQPPEVVPLVQCCRTLLRELSCVEQNRSVRGRIRWWTASGRRRRLAGGRGTWARLFRTGGTQTWGAGERGLQVGRRDAIGSRGQGVARCGIRSLPTRPAASERIRAAVPRLTHRLRFLCSLPRHCWVA